MSKKGRYGAGIGVVTALIPLMTVVVRYFLERRRERYRDSLDGEYDDRYESAQPPCGQ